MKCIDTIKLADVQAVYSGPEGDLWELIMGEQIHIGGLQSSMALAEKAGIRDGMAGVDFCCCSGAGMRFLLRFMKVANMTGVDATERMILRGKQRCREEGMAETTAFILADVCGSGLPDSSHDFVWGEDAWCYVENKDLLIAEAVRITKPEGIIAFTDWLEGDGLTEVEAERFMRFMKFPTVQTLDGYSALLQEHNCEVACCDDTGRFPTYIDLYLDMLNKQLTYDALKLIGFDMALMETMAREMVFMQELAHAGKIIQGMIVAHKPA